MQHLKIIRKTSYFCFSL